MELDIPRVWVTLRPRFEPDGIVVLGFEDSEGARVLGPEPGQGGEWSERRVPLAHGGELSVLVPTVLGAVLREAVGRLDRRRGGATHPPVVPVFVRASAPLSEVDWRSVVVGGPADPERFVQVAARPRGVTPPPFTLPLRVLAVGPAGAQVVDRLRALHNPWLDDAEGPAPGVVRVVPDAASARALLRGSDVGLLLLDGADARRPVITRGGAVRLAVVLGEQVGAPLPRARSVLALPGEPPGESGRQRPVDLAGQVDRLLRALTHDLPLHDAVREAVPGWTGAGLSASPQSVHDLRLTPAWLGAERRVVRYEGILGQGAHRWSALERRLDHRLLPPVRPDRPVPAMPDISFVRETDGLRPLRDLVRRLDEADAWLDEVADRAGDRVVDGPAEQPPRVVNITLQRGAGTLARGASSNYVDMHRSLAAHSRYALEVQIGAPTGWSVVVGEPEPIDLLLPDSAEGHRLTVTVFSDSLDVLGPTSQDLDLPPRGASQVARFDVETRDPGDGQARVAVYFRGNLVQTYRVRLKVTDEEQVGDVPAISAALEHTSTERWDDLDLLTERALSLILNADDRGTHRVYVKRGDLDEQLPLDVDALGPTVDQMRELLGAVVNSEKVAQPLADLGRETLVTLARLGSDAYFSVFGRSYPGVDRELLESLEPLRSAVGAAVQVTRVDIHQAVPWGQLYDWAVAEEGPVEACFGTRDDGTECGHGPDDGVACVNGFWGVRLLLEELLPESAARARQQAIQAADGAVLSLGVSGDPFTTGLASDVTALLPPGAVRDLTPQDVLLDTVFGAEGKPGIIVVLGPYLDGAPGTRHPHDRIKVPTVENHLTPNAVLRKVAKARAWQAPARPLVFLLSCGSTAVRKGDLTTFLSALVAAGAAAIIGTRCDVYTSLAREFSVAVLTRMKQDQEPYGQAVREVRRALLTRGDVRALVFDAFGHAELTLV